MKSYACYPGARFQPTLARFVTPRHQPFISPFQNGPTAATPTANILREDAAYVIQLAVPGLSKEDIKIEIHNDELVITAMEVKKEGQPNFVRREFDYNGFKRTFRLHKNANTEALSASFHQGILTIVVPDREPETRKIEIL